MAAIKQFRYDINALRALSVIIVVLYHFKIPFLGAGFVGVDVFFVISGYLMTGIVFSGIDSKFSLAKFYLDRAYRIIPALAVVVLAFALVGWFIFYPVEYKQLAKESIFALFFASNILYWKESGYFDAGAEDLYLLHTWSLAIEWQFYILYPLIILVAARAIGKDKIGKVLIFLFLISFFSSVYSAEFNPNAAFYMLNNRAWELIAGGLLFLYGDKFDYRGGQFLGVSLIAVSVVFFNPQIPWPGIYTLVPVLGALLVISAKDNSSGFSSSKVLQFLGSSSYSIYLWHWPVVVLFNVYGFLDSYTYKILGIAVSILLGWLSYKYVEQFFLRIKLRKLDFKSAAILAAIFASFMSPLIYIYHSNGVPDANRPLDIGKVEVIQYYDRLHKEGLEEYYMLRCDYYNHEEKKARLEIDPSCVNKIYSGAKGIFLWGDSHAQALSYGLRRLIVGKEINFFQVATSGCSPSIGSDLRSSKIDNNCEHSNKYALDTIKKLRPDVVIMAQANFHNEVDWKAVAEELKSYGVRKIVLVGPVPQYKPALPTIFVRHEWQNTNGFISRGLQNSVLKIDGVLNKQFVGKTEIEYLSPISALCQGVGCKVILPNGELLLLDYGHLTPSGSEFLAGIIFKELLNNL